MVHIDHKKVATWGHPLHGTSPSATTTKSTKPTSSSRQKKKEEKKKSSSSMHRKKIKAPHRSSSGGSKTHNKLNRRPAELAGVFTGLYFLRPVDEWILAGNKTIETRRYPLEAELVGKKIAVIANGEGKPKCIVGVVSFGASTPYVYAY